MPTELSPAAAPGTAGRRVDYIEQVRDSMRDKTDVTRNAIGAFMRDRFASGRGDRYRAASLNRPFP
jgi:hypothetical protein